MLRRAAAVVFVCFAAPQAARDGTEAPTALSCVDLHSDCLQWQLMGLCQAFDQREHMAAMCPRTCADCVAPEYADTAVFVFRGQKQ